MVLLFKVQSPEESYIVFYSRDLQNEISAEPLNAELLFLLSRMKNKQKKNTCLVWPAMKKGKNIKYLLHLKFKSK